MGRGYNGGSILRSFWKREMLVCMSKRRILSELCLKSNLLVYNNYSLVFKQFMFLPMTSSYSLWTTGTLQCKYHTKRAVPLNSGRFARQKRVDAETKLSICRSTFLPVLTPRSKDPTFPLNTRDTSRQWRWST